MDRALNANGSIARLIFISLKGWDIQYTLWFEFSSTNNETEYKALIFSLTIAKELEVQHLKVHSNSQLLMSHILNEYEAQEESMKQYL